jgi:hypothetical protein
MWNALLLTKTGDAVLGAHYDVALYSRYLLSKHPAAYQPIFMTDAGTRHCRSLGGRIHTGFAS